MKFYIASENRHIDIDQAFTLNNIQYPAGYLRSITPAKREAMGLQEVVEVGVRKSQETHFVTEELVGAELRITCVPKPKPSEQEKALKVIAEFEAKVTPRMLRESALGIEASKTMLNDIQVAIEVERAKLK